MEDGDIRWVNAFRIVDTYNDAVGEDSGVDIVGRGSLTEDDDRVGGVPRRGIVCQVRDSVHRRDGHRQ